MGSDSVVAGSVPDVVGVDELSVSQLAGRAGVLPEDVEQLVQLGILVSGEGERPFTSGDVRRVRLVGACVEAGLPLEGIGAAMAAGKLTLRSLTIRCSGGRAALLAELTQRAARARGGLPVKWLGDGVMFFFKRPGAAVRSALEMVQEAPAAGLPPAHTGIHAGPIVVQDGDYFGRTVNLAARIAGHAGAGQVLVTDEVVAAAEPDSVRFEALGPVRLKGFTRPIRLHLALPASQRQARQPGSPP